MVNKTFKIQPVYDDF